mmetsp:Transcript_50130/g.68192  ORF Transcript_50130/g.68192 Transcript_50130/m.68192 type:complete len:291 (-) Transcript_50130:125-997(-)
MSFLDLEHAFDELETSIRAVPDTIQPKNQHEPLAKHICERVKKLEKELDRYNEWEKGHARLVRLARETDTVQKGEKSLRRSLTLSRRTIEDEIALRGSGSFSGCRRFVAILAKLAKEIHAAFTPVDAPFCVDYDDTKFEAVNDDDVRDDAPPLTVSISGKYVVIAATLQGAGGKMQCSKVDVTRLENDDITVGDDVIRSVGHTSRRDLRAAFNCALDGDVTRLRSALVASLTSSCLEDGTPPVGSSVEKEQGGGDFKGGETFASSDSEGQRKRLKRTRSPTAAAKAAGDT